MSKSAVKEAINANIKTNGNQEITGQILNSVLNAMVDDYEEEGVSVLKEDIVQDLGNATDKVMSQSAVSEAIKSNVAYAVNALISTTNASRETITDRKSGAKERGVANVRKIYGHSEVVDGSIINYNAKTLTAITDGVTHTINVDAASLVDGDGSLIYPHGMRSAQSVADEVDIAANRAYKRIGRTLLKDLSYTYVNGIFVAAVTGCKHRGAILAANYDFYYALYGSDFANQAPDKSIGISGYYAADNICIKDSAYTDVASFKAHFDENDYVYYELNEEVVYDVDTSALGGLYPSAPSGTEAITPTEGTSALIAEIAYSVDVEQRAESFASLATMLSSALNREVSYSDGVWSIK